MAHVLTAFVAVAMAACATTEPRATVDVAPDAGGGAGAGPSGLVVNEVMSDNDGAWVDELAEADDWIELFNSSASAIELSRFEIADSGERWTQLPDEVLDSGAYIVLFADDEQEQGPRHLPFKLSATSDEVRLRSRSGQLVDSTRFEALGVNESWVRSDAGGDWARCRYASPGRDNAGCQAPAANTEEASVEFEPFTWPAPFPVHLQGVVLNELALRPTAEGSAAIELYNAGPAAIEVGQLLATIAEHAPALPWPQPADGAAIALPDAQLLPGEQLVVNLEDGLLAGLAASEAFEGVVTLFTSEGEVLDRVDFMRWPEGATLARPSDGVDQLVYCQAPTLGRRNECEMVRSRDVGDRVRYLRTEGDYDALALGATELGIQSVKFVVDQAAPGLVHLLSSATWPLHYTFIREKIYLQPALDRCDPPQKVEFDAGWYDFSVAEYFETDDARRFLLGTLSIHGSTSTHAVEYTFGDAINGEQMLRGFFAVTPHTLRPVDWVLRPQDDEQTQRIVPFDGRAPLVAPEAPFIGVTYQPLTEGVAYGVLTFVPAAELYSVPLGPTVIVVTDDVPNDIPLVGGLVTEAFQTPLAHVNVLSQNRGTPNAALRDARTELAAFVDELVRLEVTPAGLRVELTTPEAATAFWEQQRPERETFVARRDTSVRGVQELSTHGLESLPAIGAKAAQMAEMGRMTEMGMTGRVSGACAAYGPPTLPATPMAVPLVHYLEHFSASGAEAMLTRLTMDASFVADPLVRAEGLAQVRQAILDFPVDAELLGEVESAVEERFGTKRVRFRSSSNTEDLPTFNGAGLYTSISAQIGKDDRAVDDALRTVWASLWNARAYDEREYAGVDNNSVAMGVLVHPAFISEEANGVGVSRNVLDPARGDIYYVNVQLGEASVTNPAPGVTTDEAVYRWRRTPLVVYSSTSSLLRALPAPPEHVLADAEIEEVACALDALHSWFRPLLDPEQSDPWFAMETEFKVVESPERHIVLKQARPHSFAHQTVFDDCREL